MSSSAAGASAAGGFTEAASPRPGTGTADAATGPRLLAAFSAGEAGSVDLSRFVPKFVAGTTRLRLRADLAPRGSARLTAGPVDAQSQYPEIRFATPVLTYGGEPAGSLRAGASALRVQIESTNTSFDEASEVSVSAISRIQIDAPLARLKHGLDSWESLDELNRSVQGSAAPGSFPSGRTDLIGAVFEITPGMFSEEVRGEGGRTAMPSAVATVQFPCTLRAADGGNRPVFRSLSGERDIIRIEASLLPPIDGEVTLQDLVIRDNRGWYDTGEAGVRIKDRFAGRSVRIERCEFVRCQNAIAGGNRGQTLRILDCRIVDCGFGDQAHCLYVQPEWLEFYGNVLTFSTGNRFARAHMLKTRALNSRVLGNHFAMNDCPASFLIDVSNGGECELGGNILHHGARSDNTGATLIAYAPEGASADTGTVPPSFSAGRRFSLVARNNSMLSDFPGRTHFIVANDHFGQRFEGGSASTFPDPFVVADNMVWAVGTHALVTRRDRQQLLRRIVDISAQHPDNTRLGRRPELQPGGPGEPSTPRLRNSGGVYQGRRFSGHTALGTGSRPHDFIWRGAV